MRLDASTIIEPAREIEVVHRTDVLVVGSGPGGLAAALAAARAGAEVTLLERFGCFGGNLTVVGVEGLAWYRHEQTVEANGIGREFEERAKADGSCRSGDAVAVARDRRGGLQAGRRPAGRGGGSAPDAPSRCSWRR